MMRFRSYEYCEVVTGLNDKNHKVLYRGSYENAKRELEHLAPTVDGNEANLYLVRCQLLAAYKSDKS